MAARHQLAAALAPVLPPAVRIIDHPQDLDQIDAATRAVIMLTRESFAPAAHPGSQLNEFELIVIEPSRDPGGATEDALEEITAEVITALDGLTWLIWSRATRATFDNQYAAYKIDLSLITQHEKSVL